MPERSRQVIHCNAKIVLLYARLSLYHVKSSISNYARMSDKKATRPGLGKPDFLLAIIRGLKRRKVASRVVFSRVKT